MDGEALEQGGGGNWKPAHGAGLLRAAIARTLGQFLSRHPGLSRGQLIADAGLEPQLLANPNGWLSVSAIARLLDTVAASSGVSAVGLGFAQQLPWHDLGVLGQIGLHSPTVGAAFANVSRYFSVISTGASTWLEVDGAHAQLRYGIHDPAIDLHAQNSEFVFAMFTRIVREATNDPTWTPLELHFRHPRPASTEVQETFFGCPMRFERRYDALVVPTAGMGRAFVNADSARLDEQLSHGQRGLPDDRALFSDRVSSIVLSSLRSGEVTLDQVAARLGTSTRTLQRRLLQQGHNFHSLIAELRAIVARRYVTDPSLTLSEAAARLGYSELSSFSRAFRRWTGMSPFEYRRRHTT